MQDKANQAHRLSQYGINDIQTPSTFLIETSHNRKFQDLVSAQGRFVARKAALEAGLSKPNTNNVFRSQTKIATILQIDYANFRQSKRIFMKSFAMSAGGRFHKQQEVIITRRHHRSGDGPHAWTVEYPYMRLEYFNRGPFRLEFIQVAGRPANGPEERDYIWSDWDLQVYAAGVSVLHEGFPELDSSMLN